MTLFTLEEVQAAAEELQSMPAARRRVLAQIVEQTAVTRNKSNSAIEALSDAGFVYVSDLGSVLCPEIRVRSTLIGEAALQYLEEGHQGMEFRESVFPDPFEAEDDEVVESFDRPK